MKIALIGFMGAGKTWLGKRLDTELKSRFLDLDDYIEKQEKSTVAELFESYGENGFRKREKEYFEKQLNRKSIILSTGGGLPIYQIVGRQGYAQRFLGVFLFDQDFLCNIGQVQRLEFSGVEFCLKLFFQRL